MGEIELASRWLRGRIVAITGTKGKSTTTTLTGRMLEAGGHHVLVGGNIGHGAERPGGSFDGGDDPRGRGEQLSARGERRRFTLDRGAAELLARTSRSSRGRGRVRGGQGTDLRGVRPTTTGRCSMPTTPPSSRGGTITRHHDGCCFRAHENLTDGIVLEGGRDCRRRGSGTLNRWCRCHQSVQWWQHLVADVVAASAVALARRRRARRQ